MTQAVVHHPYTLIETDQDAAAVCEYLATESLLALDTETHANGKSGPKAMDPKKAFTDPFINTVRLVQIRSRDSESFIFDVRKLGIAGNLSLAQLLSQEHITWIAHNCFPGDTLVTLANGTKLPIRKIVQERLSVEVLSYNESTGKMEPKLVTNWFDNGMTNDWLQIETEARRLVTCTPNHKFLVKGRGWCRADEITINDTLLNETPKLTEIQEGLIYGSLLGDASIVLQKDAAAVRPYFTVAHAGHRPEARAYLEHKREQLAILGGSIVAEKRNYRGYSAHREDATLVYFRTSCHFSLLEVLDRVCPSKTGKLVNLAWLEKVNAAGLAYWYLDDGHLSHRKGRGTSESFVPTLCVCRAETEVQLLQDWMLSTWALATSRRTRADGAIYIEARSKQDAAKFFKLISPFVPACMEYKLPEEYRGQYHVDTIASEPMEVKVLSVRPRIARQDRKFCLEVQDNHNFFANGILASNCKFDYKMLAVNLNVHLAHVYDTMIAATCLGFATGDQAASARGYSLKDVVRDYLCVHLDKAEQLSNWSARDLTDGQLQYAADDLLHLFDLYDLFAHVIKHEYSMNGGVQLEMDVLPVVAKIELNGMALDERMFNLLQQSAAAYLPALEEELCKYIGWPMMPTTPLVRLKTKRMFAPKPVSFGGKGSSPIMSNAIMLEAFRKKGLPLENLQGDYLEELAKSSDNLILKKFVFYRDLAKQLSTNYLDWVHPVTGRIHPNLNQCGASTGRFSGSDPNPQNVPTLSVEVPAELYEANKDFLIEYFDEKKGKCFLNYRFCFVPAKGKKMLSLDYSGQEVRMMVALSKDPNMIKIHHEPAKILRDGKMVKNMAADVHAMTAELMWNKEYGVTCWNADELVHPTIGKKFRTVAKVIVFGLAFGKSATGMALDWGISKEDAQAIIDEFFRAYPTLKKWLDSKGQEANDTRMAWYGCRAANIIRWRMVSSARHTDKGALDRAGRNTPIQGGSALQMKLAMVYMNRSFSGTNIKLIGVVHDEAILECPAEDEELAASLGSKCMTEAGDVFLQNILPSTCGVGIGTHWFH